MFHDPLLHLGARLFAGQRAGLNFRPDGLALLGELLGKGCLLRRRIGTNPGTEPGTGAKLHASVLSTLEGTKLPHATGHHHLPATGPGKASAAADVHRTAHRSPALHGAALQGAALQGPALQGPALQRPTLQRPTLQAAELSHLLRTRHCEAAHVEALDLARLETGDLVDSGEAIEPAAGLCVRRHRHRSECHGETKELDGAHLRLL